MRKKSYKYLSTAKRIALRSFFIYKNGDLFCQLNKNEIVDIPEGAFITLHMKSAIIQGRVKSYTGTGLVLYEWTIERR